MALPENHVKAARMYERGDPIAFIEFACGVGSATIYKAARALGIPKRTKAKRSRRARIEAKRAANSLEAQ